MIRFVANCFYIILALLFSFFQSFNIFFFMFFITFFFFCWNRIMALRKIKHRCRDADYSNFRLCFLLFWAFFGLYFFLFHFFVLCRFTRITTHSCYTVGYFAWGSLNTVLRHVRTYNGENNNQLKKQKLNNYPCSDKPM